MNLIGGKCATSESLRRQGSCSQIHLVSSVGFLPPYTFLSLRSLLGWKGRSHLTGAERLFGDVRLQCQSKATATPSSSYRCLLCTTQSTMARSSAGSMECITVFGGITTSFKNSTQAFKSVSTVRRAKATSRHCDRRVRTSIFGPVSITRVCQRIPQHLAGQKCSMGCGRKLKDATVEPSTIR